MADEWDKYIVNEQDDWEQYAVKPSAQQQSQKSILQMLGSNIKEAGMETSAQAANLLNSLLLGIPEFATQKLTKGQKHFVYKEDLSGGDRLAGELLGYALPLGAVAKGASSLVKGAGLGAKIARGAIAGGAVGAVIPPSDDFVNLKKRGEQAIVSGIIGSALSLGGAGLEKIKTIFKQGNSAEQAGILKNIQKEFSKVKSDAIDTFGTKIERLSIERPNAITPEAGNLFETLKTNPEEYQQALPILKRIPGLKEFITNPGKADRLTAGKLQEWINYIQTKIPVNIKATNLDLIEFVNDLKAAQLEAFPEMSAIRNEYKTIIEPFKQVKNQFKVGRLNAAIQNDFSDPQNIEAVKEVFKDKPEILKQMGNYKKAQQTLRMSKDILQALIKWGAVGTGVGALGALGAKAVKDTE